MKHSILAIFVLFVAVALCAQFSAKAKEVDFTHYLDLLKDESSLKDGFADYMKKYNKVYADAKEQSVRLQNFRDSLKRIVHKNLVNTKAHYALDKWSDMSREEFRHARLLPKIPAQSAIQSCLATGVDKVPEYGNVKLPDSFDWRDYGKVTPVKDQGQCGSCWTFSVTGVIESFYAIKQQTNATLVLSEQAIVDCSHSCSNVDGQSICNQGCNGGWMWTALFDAATWGGLPTEDDYPYHSTDGTCQITGKKLNAPPKNFTCLSGPNQNGSPADETTLMPTVLMKSGPLSIALNADLVEDYSSGVIDPYWPDLECAATSLDHAVLIVGWGVDPGEIWGDTPYWTVKNSWGESWGEDGYFRIFRGAGVCGLNAAVMTITMK